MRKNGIRPGDNAIITAETIYQKVKMLDTHTLREVADFLDFLLSKRREQNFKRRVTCLTP